MFRRDMTPYTLLGDIYVNVPRYEGLLEEQPNGCIHYMGAKHRQGYGFQSAIRASDGHKLMVTAHRIAARLKYGRAISSDELVLHTCTDQPGWHKCCNPNHIILGDKAKMIDIMDVNKKLVKGKRGPRNAVQTGRKYKYSIAEMVWIRDPKTNVREVMAKYNFDITKAACLQHRMRNGYTWLDQYNADGTKK